MTDEKQKNKNTLSLLQILKENKLFLATFLAILTTLTLIFASESPSIFPKSSEHLGTFGDFVGGLLNPLLTFLTILLLIKTIRQNQQIIQINTGELQNSTQELKQTRIAFQEEVKTSKLKFHFDLLDRFDEKIVDILTSQSADLRQFSRLGAGNGMGTNYDLISLFEKADKNKPLMEGLKFDLKMHSTTYQKLLFVLKIMELMAQSIKSISMEQDITYYYQELPSVTCTKRIYAVVQKYKMHSEIINLFEAIDDIIADIPSAKFTNMQSLYPSDNIETTIWSSDTLL